MKKMLIILAIALSAKVHAQTIQVGAKGGLNASNFIGKSVSGIEDKMLVSYHAGGFMHVGFGAVGLQPELLLSSQGAKINDQSFKVTYLNLPVMLRIKPAGNFFLELGPQVGFKISSAFDANNEDEFVKNLDVSAAAGLGIQPLSGLGFGVRYVLGLSKLGDFETADFQNANYKNGVLQLSLYLSLGRK